MAKSIRSKRMRKLRAFKRIRYGEKELARLKEMLAKAAEEEKSETPEPGSTKEARLVPMDVDTGNACEKNDQKKPPKYPCWLSHFKIRKLAKQEKKQKRKEMKRLKKERKATKKSKCKKSR